MPFLASILDPGFIRLALGWRNRYSRGVNVQRSNHYVFHTTDKSAVSDQSQTGTVESWNCFVNAQGQFNNQGYGGWSASSGSYGDKMNSIGGGVYAMNWVTKEFAFGTFHTLLSPSLFAEELRLLLVGETSTLS